MFATSNIFFYCCPKIDGNESFDISELFRCYFEVFFKSFFDVFFSMFYLFLLCLFFIFSFLYVVFRCFVVDPHWMNEVNLICWITFSDYLFSDYYNYCYYYCCYHYYWKWQMSSLRALYSEWIDWVMHLSICVLILSVKI